MESVLKDLEVAEDEVCEIMKVAEETLQELQNLPQCDTDKLTALSSKYMELIKSVYLRLSAHSSTMTKTDERDDSNIYTSSKEREIYDSLMTLSDTTAHDDENFWDPQLYLTAKILSLNAKQHELALKHVRKGVTLHAAFWASRSTSDSSRQVLEKFSKILPLSFACQGQW